MKRFLFIGICLFISAVVTRVDATEIKYIKTVVKITLRTGPGIDHKIKSMIKSGQEVKVLEEGSKWSLIRTSQGSEGWILTNLLTAERPGKFIPHSNMDKNNELLSEHAASLEVNRTLGLENKGLVSELARSREVLATLKKSYDKLKKESAHYLKVKSDYKQAAGMLTEQKKRTKQFENKIAELELQQNIWWFLTGAGVLIFGFIIGYVSKRQRRRPSLL